MTKKNEDHFFYIKKTMHHKIELNDEFKNYQNFYKKTKKKKDHIVKNYIWQIKIEGLHWKQIKI